MEQGVRRHDYKQILWLSCPMFFETMLRTLLGNINQFMLSRYSAVAVAAVGNANQILNMMLIVLNVVCVASTIIIVQCIGSEKTEELSEIYFTVVSACFILQGIFMSLSAIFRSNSMMKEIMMISIFSNVFNVFGNLLFINGFGVVPALGVLGAVLSTVLSLFISAGLIAFLLYRNSWNVFSIFTGDERILERAVFYVVDCSACGIWAGRCDADGNRRSMDWICAG